MIIDIKEFFNYLNDCNKTLPHNKRYDALIKKLLRGDTIEVLEGGLWKYMIEDNGKVIFVTKLYNA